MSKRGKILLIEINKELLKEWDYEKNAPLDPSSVLAYSSDEIFWKCQKGHSWKTQVISRVSKKSKCPYCNGQKAIIGENDVVTLYPNIAKEFHPTKNKSVKLENYKEGSGKKVWWKCKNGHEWKAVINTRTKRGYGCPYCSGALIYQGESDFLTLFPNIAKEVHPTKNKGIDLEKIGGKTSMKIWWKCPKGHEYEMAINKRTVRGSGCPFCSGRYAIKGENDLKTLFPETIRFWNEEINGDMSNYKSHSSKKVMWKCQNGHTWENAIRNQVNCNICPLCANRVLVSGKNDLETLFPELAQEWDEEKNGKKACEQKVSAHEKCYWKCKKGHGWKSEIHNRVQGKRCPYCAGKLPIEGENDLKTIYPEIASEWHPTKNKKKASDYLPQSNKSVWWKCEKGHEWRECVSNRTTYGARCQICKDIDSHL